MGNLAKGEVQKMNRIRPFPTIDKSDVTMFSCYEQLKIQKGILALMALEPKPLQEKYEEVKDLGNRISDMLEETGILVTDRRYLEKEEEFMQKFALERHPDAIFRKEIVSDITTRVQAMIHARELMTKELHPPKCVTE